MSVVVMVDGVVVVVVIVVVVDGGVVVGVIVVVIFVVVDGGVAYEGLSFVREISVAACQDVSASSDHVFCESKLLAVEDEELSVFVNVSFTLFAFVLQATNTILLVMDLVVVDADAHPVVVVMDAVMVLGDAVVVGRDAVFEVVDHVVEVDKSISHGLESDHKCSLLLESCFVVWLLPDLFPFVELVDLVPEVTGWDVDGWLYYIMILIVVVLHWWGFLNMGWLLVVLFMVILVVVSWVAVAIATVVVGVVNLRAAVVAVVVSHGEGD